MGYKAYAETLFENIPLVKFSWLGSGERDKPVGKVAEYFDKWNTLLIIVGILSETVILWNLTMKYTGKRI